MKRNILFRVLPLLFCVSDMCNAGSTAFEELERATNGSGDTATVLNTVFDGSKHSGLLDYPVAYSPQPTNAGRPNVYSPIPVPKPLTPPAPLLSKNIQDKGIVVSPLDSWQLGAIAQAMKISSETPQGKPVAEYFYSQNGVA